MSPTLIKSFLLLLQLNSLFATDRERSLSRHKRHSFKHGNCRPIITDLSQGLRILHETHVREERFYVRPRSTFRKIMLQMRLDNTIVDTPPKIYNARVEYTIDDLEKSNFTSDDWIPVTTKLYKDKQLFHDYYILRLAVGSVVKEAKLQKLKFFYTFESLVFWGEGGGEWSFDCHPNHVLGSVHGHESASPFDWWMFIAVGVIVTLLVILLLCCCIVGAYKCCRNSRASASFAKIMVRINQVNYTYTIYEMYLNIFLSTCI